MGAINNLLSVQDRFLQPSDLHKNLGISSLCNFGIAGKGLRALYEDVGVQNDATGEKRHAMASSVLSWKKGNPVL